jgi:glycosyltransferase involved in cell wall biosynthesis
LKSADLCLLTSRWKALPITIAEAFQAGLPVIATDTGGVNELVSPQVGRVIQVGDVDGLVSSILEVCGDDDLRRKMIENAQKLSQKERFSLPHVHRIFELTYSEILENSLEENNG